MKKLCVYFILFLTAAGYCHQVAPPDSSEKWEKTKEEENIQEFTSTSGTIFRVTYEPVIKAAYKENPLDKEPITIFSLFEKEVNSSLKKMKQLRDLYRKENSPHSNWKLLYATHHDDIIYECKTPVFGNHPPSYEITRLVKKEKIYIKISYLSDSPITGAEFLKRLHQLQELDVNNFL